MSDYSAMSDFSGFPDLSRKKKDVARYRWVALAAISAAAILVQIYVPRFEYLSYLELPLLVTVYFAVMRRSAIAAMFFGAAIGLAQDSLSAQPLGMFGIAKTLVGYLGVMASLRVDVERTSVRTGLAIAFFAFHQLLHWMMVRSLLGQDLGFDWPRLLVQAVLNGAIAAPLYHLLDKLKISE